MEKFEFSEGHENDGINDNDIFGFGDTGDDSFTDFGNEDFGRFDSDEYGSTSIQSFDMGDANPDPSTSGFDFQLNNTEVEIVQFATNSFTGTRRRAATKKSEKIYITHEDFQEGPEQDAFLLIYGYSENLFESQNSKMLVFNAKKERAINFFFCKTLMGLHLEDAVACIDTSIRIDVLRLRFMLEFWMRDWVLPLMPITADELPARVELMAAQHGGVIGVELASGAWLEPGITAEKLLQQAADSDDVEVIKQVKKSFIGLVDAYILSISKGKVYTTGKNPILELEDKANDPKFNQRGRLANLYWSRKF